MGTISDIMRPAERFCFDIQNYDKCMDFICRENHGPYSFYAHEDSYQSAFSYSRMRTNRELYEVAVTEYQTTGNLRRYRQIIHLVEVQGQISAKTSLDVCQSLENDLDPKKEPVTTNPKEETEPDFKPVARITTRFISEQIVDLSIFVAGSIFTFARKYLWATASAVLRGETIINSALPLANPGGLSPMLIIAPKSIFDHLLDEPRIKSL